MNLFLASAIGATAKVNGKRCAGKIDNRYGFLSLFRQKLGNTNRMLYLSSDPNDNQRITEYYLTTIDAFKAENICWNETIFVNGNNSCHLERYLQSTDVIFLAGGHLPTQNSFFQSINLKQLLQNFQGIIVAQSAGSMNCAETVYVCPEVEGEAINKSFDRYRPGLGLTDINIIPHYDKNRYYTLDNLMFYEEVIYPDTFVTPLYLLTDGSFFFIDEKSCTAHGEIYLYHNGRLTPYSSSTPLLP